MDIQQFVNETSQRAIPLSDLAIVAADRTAFGDDVIAALKTQVEQRSRTAQSVLTSAEQAGRDSLLATEQRGYDAAVRERTEILGLLQAVERRTETRNHVPIPQAERPTSARRTIFGADEFRALVGNTGSGSYVAPDEASASFFDKLSAASVAFASGIRTITTNRATRSVFRA